MNRTDSDHTQRQRLGLRVLLKQFIREKYYNCLYKGGEKDLEQRRVQQWPKLCVRSPKETGIGAKS